MVKWNYEAWGKNPLAEEGSGEELLSLMASDDLTHTMVRLTEAYLNTLSVGEHTLAVQFSDDGIARAVFYIKDPETKTADTGVFTGVAGGAVATGLGFMVLGAMAGAVYAIKRH